MSHFQHRYGVPKSPVFRFCERKWNDTSKFNIASLHIYFLFITFIFVGFYFLNFRYFDLLPLELLLFVTLLILFHNFFLISHDFPPWKSFVISKHTHFSAAQSNGRLLLDYLPDWCQQRKNRCRRHSS